MAQENSPDKEKRQGRIKKPEKPYVEQIDELLLIHNKNDPKEDHSNKKTMKTADNQSLSAVFLFINTAN